MTTPVDNSPFDFDILIIGGGVIGMAIARAMSNQYAILLVEQHQHFGAETSSRNSEVIHAGLYYPPHSLKESLCLKGKQSLYEFCEQFDIPFRQIGKLIVSPSKDHPKLQQLLQTADRLSVPVQQLSQTELAEREPNVRAAEALFSPSTGILDSHTYLQRLEQHASGNGALILRDTRYCQVTEKSSGWCVQLKTRDGTIDVTTRCVINSSGLSASRIAQDFGLAVNQYAVYPCRGHYLSYSGASPFHHLVYPLPEANLAGLGIHATLDLGHGLRFGPDTEYLGYCETSSGDYDYRVNEALRDEFAASICQYYPELDKTRLQPDYSGIRPKLHLASQPSRDFVVSFGPENRPPSVHLLGIESPGLTASLALADLVKNRLAERFT